MASVDSTHTQGACGGDSIDPPTVGASHSPTTETEYVFVASNTVTIFKITLMNDYFILNLRFLYDGNSISKLKFFFCNFNWVPTDTNQIFVTFFHDVVIT